MTLRMTIEEILRDRSVGRMQSVAQMQVIPILGGSDDSFAPPEIEIGTTEYGRVEARNGSTGTTIVPPGSAWVVARAAQDHAVGTGSLLPAGAQRSLPAMCVQQSQGGLIPLRRYPLQILPLGLRATALERHTGDYSRLWEPIRRFKAAYGLTGAGDLVDFVGAFAKQLDEFVAEFEIVADQVGAIVLIDGAVAGLELAPSESYWEVVWEPLIRLCYGSLALYAHRTRGSVPPATRTPLVVRERTVHGIAAALDAAESAQADIVRSTVKSLASRELRSVKGSESRCDAAKMQTVKGDRLIGQIVHTAVPEPAVKFASLIAR